MRFIQRADLPTPREVAWWCLGFVYIPACVAVAAALDLLLIKANVTWFLVGVPTAVFGTTVRQPRFRSGLFVGSIVFMFVLIGVLFLEYSAKPYIGFMLFIGFMAVGALVVSTSTLLDLIRRTLDKDAYLYPSDVRIILRYFGGSILFYTCLFTAMQLDNKEFLSIGHPSSMFVDIFYFNVVTFTTLGYGDVVPITAMAKLLVALENLTSFFLVGLGIGCIAKGIHPRK
jgi:hypothetical protein